MRLIDADELKEVVFSKTDGMEDLWDTAGVLNLINKAPTVEITEEQAIDKLHETSWLPRHDKEMTERPQGEWISADDELPQDMQRVLVWFEYFRYGDFNCMYQTYGFGYVCDGKWSPFINGETGWQDYRVIAWQPLPEPYKKEGAE